MKSIKGAALLIGIWAMSSGCDKNDNAGPAVKELTLPYTLDFSEYRYNLSDRFFTSDKLTLYCLDGIDHEINWIIWLDCYNTSYAHKVEYYRDNLRDSGIYLGGLENTLIADISSMKNINRIVVTLSDFKGIDQMGYENGRLYLCDDDGLVKGSVIPYDFKGGDLALDVSGKKVKHLNISAAFGTLVKKITFE